MPTSADPNLAPPPGPRRRVRPAALVGVVALALALSGCTANEAFFFDMPAPVTEEGAIVVNLWQGSWIAAWAVGIVTWGLMLFAVVAYRRKRNQGMPEQTKYNLPLEVLYTVVPLIMILGLFFFTARDQTALLSMENDQKQTVNVVGFRWSWAFNYINNDVYDVGTPGVPPTLVLPVGEKVRFQLTSPDVIHSFWVPDFLFKMDVIPGKMNEFELTPTKLGTFPGRCAELCGTDHARMLFNVKVVDRAEFDQHLADLRAKGQTGKLSSDLITTDGERDSDRRIL